MAVNKDRPAGLKLVGRHGGGVVAEANPYIVAAGDGTALFIGDLVKLAGAADAATGLATITQAAAGDTLLVGVVAGFEPLEEVTINNTNPNRTHRPVSTRMKVLVHDDPMNLYEVQEDGEGATLALVDIGENADIIVAAGNATTGTSGMELDSSDHKTATAQLRTMRFSQASGNVPASQWAKVIVMINEHFLKSTTGT